LESSSHDIVAGDSFYLTLTVTNPSNYTITNIGIDLSVTNIYGASAINLFSVGSPSLSIITGDISSNAMVPPNQQATIIWKVTSLTSYSFAVGAKSYNMGGTVTYNQESANITIPFFEAIIVNYPPTVLTAHYFIPSSFTANSPTNIGVIVTNNGYGNAHEITVNNILANMVDSSGIVLLGIF
jgi:hypothetical protein